MAARRKSTYSSLGYVRGGFLKDATNETYAPDLKAIVRIFQVIEQRSGNKRRQRRVSWQRVQKEFGMGIEVNLAQCYWNKKREDGERSKGQIMKALEPGYEEWASSFGNFSHLGFPRYVNKYA